MIVNLPPDKKNDRFYTDLFAKKRPALTFVGFDNGGNHVFGYGLKQVIERADNKNTIEYHTIVRLLKISNRSFLKKGQKVPREGDRQSESETNKKSSNRHVVNYNTRILQSKAFIALLALILEENDHHLPDLDLPPYLDTLKVVVEVLRKKKKRKRPLFVKEVAPLLAIDRVKWTTSLGNIARALDLYLAIENAYDFYGKDDAHLLTKKEKRKFLDRYYAGIEDVLIMADSGLGKKISGNWSLKMWTAAGHACLGAQRRDAIEYIQLIEWFGRALRRAGPDSTGNRRRYWSFMTSKKVHTHLVDGQRVWAEGPYYLHFTVQEMIPFWHAVRAQGYLHVPDVEMLNVSVSDPFHSNWFINPLEWMADIATPEGGTPPFDDGNRHPMYSANLMNWDRVYGHRRLGEKMNWVYEKIGEVQNGIPARWEELNNEVLLVDLAIPKVDSCIEPAVIVGNFSEFDRSEPQLIVRREINGQSHYVCLHGEGQLSSIERGEGHEQPDQLQLLYYIDKQSMLMDAGYDHGRLLKNSSWNRYRDHNVMAYVDDDGGIAAPNPTKKTVTHNPVEYLYFDSRSNDVLTIMKGRLMLKYRKDDDILGPNERSDSRYDRTVLFVADPDCPYLIDVNQVYTELGKGDLPVLQMRYHVDSNNFTSNQQNKWDTWRHNLKKNGVDLFLHLDAVEFEKKSNFVSMDKKAVRERFVDPDNKEIQRLTFRGRREPSFATVAIFHADDKSPDTLPVRLREYEAGASLTHQIWLWENQMAKTIDIVFARSYADLVILDQSISFDIPMLSKTLVSPAGQTVGYARFREVNGKWNLLPEYLYGLSEPLPPLLA